MLDTEVLKSTTQTQYRSNVSVALKGSVMLTIVLRSDAASVKISG